MLEWSPVQDDIAVFGGGRYPGRGSMRVYGYALCNFLEWCQMRRLALTDLEYTRHLVQGYRARRGDGQKHSPYGWRQAELHDAARHHEAPEN